MDDQGAVLKGQTYGAADDVAGQPRASKKIALGVSYEGRDPALLEAMSPYIDYVEITPETISEIDDDELRLCPDVVTELRNIQNSAKIIVHGVSLSIGSHDKWSETYLELLDKILTQLTVAWHSEHLGYTQVDGTHLGIMLAMPRTEQSLDLVCERITRIQERYDIEFLMENIVRVIPDAPGEYSEAEFLNILAERTGCGLLLDVYNLECDAHNHGTDNGAFLNELDHSRVRELHVACGVEHNGFLLDVHSKLPRACTLDTAELVLRNPDCDAQVIVYEFMPEAVPGLGREAIADTLMQLRHRFCGERR